MFKSAFLVFFLLFFYLCILFSLNRSRHQWCAKMKFWNGTDLYLKKYFFKSNSTFVKDTFIHALQPNFSHHLFFVCVNFIHKRLGLLFKVYSKRKIFEKLYRSNFIPFQCFWQKEVAVEIYFHISFWKELPTIWLNCGLTSSNANTLIVEKRKI